MVLFLDEINTSQHISGIIQEILLERTIYGEKINDRLVIVAACNPYKFKIKNLLSNGIRNKRKKNSLEEMENPC